MSKPAIQHAVLHSVARVGAVSLGLALLAPLAQAHIGLSFPLRRPFAELKSAPCGQIGSVRSDVVNVFAPGETITVAWDETIDHPGYYRISFDPDGQDFTIPPAIGDTSADTNVLLDLIADQAGGPNYTQTITLPDIECENCTLQLFQMMTDKPPYTTDANSNDIYYQCADIALRTGGGPMFDAAPGTPDAALGGGDGGVDRPDAAGGSGGGSGGCATSRAPAGAPAGMLLLAAVVVLGTRKRSRSRAH